MHRLEQLKQLMLRAAVWLWEQSRPVLISITNWAKEAGSRHANDLILSLGVVIGAAAFGVWRQSFAAALFSAIPLFLLAGIYKKTDQTLAAVQQSDVAPRLERQDAYTSAEPASENNDALDEAIGCLRPWVANEASLTEENAKECCAVLLALVADRVAAPERLGSSASNGNPPYSGR
jgi:hypothetical protein